MTGSSQRDPREFSRPPRLAARLLELAGGRNGSYMLGDLNEEYSGYTIAAKGKLGAVIWYWGQVIRSLPATSSSGASRTGRGWGRGRGRGRPPQRAHRFDWVHDLRLVLRALLRAPRFSVTVILMLGLGVGAGMSVYSLVDLLLFRPPAHIQDAERVKRLMLHENRPPYGAFTSGNLAWIDYEAMRTSARTLDGVAAYFAIERSLGRGEGARRVDVTLATASFFSILGVRPEVGRFFDESEDVLDAADVPCVASSRFWQRELGGAQSALGAGLIVGGLHCTVVGVAPAGFTGIDLQSVDLWLPIRPGARDLFGQRPGLWTTDRQHWVKVVARLSDGVVEARAVEDALVAYRTFPERHRDPEMKAMPEWRSIMPGRNGLKGSIVSTSTMLLVGGLVLLLLITVNLANLFVVRDLGRARETAVRLALGGSRMRLFWARVLETTLLGLAASAVAMVVTKWLGPVVRALIISNLDLSTPTITLRVAVLTAGLAVGTGILIAVSSSLRLGRMDSAALLQAAGSARSGGGRHTNGVRLAFVGVQAALSVALLVASLAFVTSFKRASEMNLGFDRENLIAATVPLSKAGYNYPARMDFYRALWQRAGATPGVVSASLGYMTPWWNNMNLDIRVPGRDSLPPEPDYDVPLFDVVTPDYLATMRLEMKRGRWIRETDIEGSAPVLVINQALSDLYWRDGDALGKCMVIGDSEKCRMVVGVVANHKFTGGVGKRFHSAYFIPLAQSGEFEITPRLFVRMSGGVERAGVAVRRLVQSQAPGLPAARIVLIEDLFERMLTPWRLGSYAFTGLGFLAVIAGTFGLLSVLFYAIAERSREFAIRTAIGATAQQIALSVMRQGVVTVALGVGAGFGLVLISSAWLQPLLFRTRLTDPRLLGVAALLSLGIAVVATILPAREAALGDPMDALRVE